MRAMVWSTLPPGSSPPSPGLAPCTILICSSSALARYQMVTPKRPDATCLMADRRESPFAIGTNRSGSSPPSPVFDLPPRRFIAMASDSWLSAEMDPKLIAPVQKRFTISVSGSTSSISIGPLLPSSMNDIRPRNVQRFVDSSLMYFENAQ